MQIATLTSIADIHHLDVVISLAQNFLTKSEYSAVDLEKLTSHFLLVAMARDCHS